MDTPNVAPGHLAIDTNPSERRTRLQYRPLQSPAARTLGNAPRRFFYGPGIYNFDMALEKEFASPNPRSLEFRVEGFNVFNHAQFYGPAAVNGNISSANFGQVVSGAAPRLMQLAAKFFF